MGTLMDAPLTDRQCARIRSDICEASTTLTLAIIEDGQSVDEFTQVLADSGQSARSAPVEVVRINVPPLFDRPDLLVQRFHSATTSADWIVVVVGSSHCPHELVQLIHYCAEAEFDVPRIVVVVEKLDLTHGSAQLRSLATIIPPLDLTLNDDWAEYQEILKKIWRLENTRQTPPE
jgi:hypothetical protein